MSTLKPDKDIDNFQFKSDLNPIQLEAVCHTDGPVLVLAGAGTGKTRVLTSRVSYILSCGLAPAHCILGVTFTNKAAAEIKNRLVATSQSYTHLPWIGTFHSIGAKILRSHPELAGLGKNFVIIDSDDQLRMIKQIIKEENIDDKLFPAKKIAAAINRWKDKDLSPARAAELEDSVLARFYEVYEQRLRVMNAADFCDLIGLNLKIFKENKELLERYQQQFRFILVDEYQDTNLSQYLWLRLLAKGHKNIFCVGDDDQSIYGWRGAEIANILRFEKDYPESKIFRLEQNYRSTSIILKAANALIHHNKDRYQKNLWTQQSSGEAILIRAHYDANQEAQVVAEYIQTLHNNGHKLTSMTILVRAIFQTRIFEERLMHVGIPYRVVGGLRFYERQEIRDCLAYLRLLIQPDDSLAFERIVNLPRRGIGETTLQKLHQYARTEGISLPKAAQNEKVMSSVTAKAKTSLEAFFALLEKLRQEKSTNSLSHVSLVEKILLESGYIEMWTQEKTIEAAGKLENIKELVQAISQFQSIEDFLEHVSLVMDTHTTQQDDMISLMTIHAAKGLEFDTVILPGWEEGLFPHQRSLNESPMSGLEEERRLAYVAISRAKQRVLITYAYSRKGPQGWQQSQPSRFISELPKEICSFKSPENLDSLSQQSVAIRNHLYLNGFKTGDDVDHDVFGIGKIIAFEGNWALVKFQPPHECKKILSTFLKKSF